MNKNILILGGGFGGLEVATSLRAQLDGSFIITLIDKNEFFTIGFTKFDLMFGRKGPEDIKNYYVELHKQGINFVLDTIEKIDPLEQIVSCTGGDFMYDYLVIGLGADLHQEAIPGFTEGGYSFYSFKDAKRLRPVIQDLKSGTVMLSVFSDPYQCPPAPYEAALQIHDYFENKGIREDISIKILVPGTLPLPESEKVSDSILIQLEKYDIEFLPEHKVLGLDFENKNAIIEGQEPMAYDLFLGVAVHLPPQVILDSALGKDGWIKVNRENLRTEFDNVYAIGDVTHIPVGDFAIPKIGAFAEEEAKVVVIDLINRIKGQNNKLLFNPTGTCFMELGSGKVIRIQTTIVGEDCLQTTFVGPSMEYRADKIEFETSRIRRWFNKMPNTHK